MKPIEPGPYRQRLVVQRYASAPDGSGGFVWTYSPLATVWGRLWPQPPPAGGKEVEALEKVVASVTHLFAIRYSSLVATLTPKDRFSWNGRTFEIVTVMNTEARNRELTGTAIEVTA